jgi:putative hydrolase of HD superfamily
MKTKNDPPITLLERTGIAHPLIEFYYEFAQIKQLYRQGWLKRGLPEEKCESVADHTLGVVMLAYIVAEQHMPSLDVNKVMRLALLHDLPESITGDPTPSDNIPDEEKARREIKAGEHLFRRFPNSETYISLVSEYVLQSTPEARFVYQMDKLEMALQASIYEKQGQPNLSEFFPYVQNRLAEPEVKKILEELIVIR